MVFLDGECLYQYLVQIPELHFLVWGVHPVVGFVAERGEEYEELHPYVD